MKEGWKMVKLGEVCEIRPSRSIHFKSLKETNKVSFLPMEDLGIYDRNIKASKTKLLKEVSGSYTYFENDDVLLAKVTPCFENGKLGIANNLVNGIGFGSSEYIVFRPCSDIASEFVYYVLSNSQFRNEGKRMMLGACGLKRLSKDFVNSYEFPLPPLEEQHRIVGIFDAAFEKIDTLKANAEENLKNAKALFQQVLSQELQPKEGWVEKKIGEVCSLKSGNSSSNNSKDGDLAYIKVADLNLKENKIAITTSTKYVDKQDNIKNIFPIGSIIFPKRGGAILTNKKRITSIEICCDLNIMGVIPSVNLEPYYLYYYFLSIDMGKICNGTTILQINNCDISPLLIPFPTDISEQHRIVATLDTLSEKCRRLEQVAQQIIRECDALKQSILRQAFSGEL